MKWTVIIVALFILLSASALGQPNQYSTGTASGAPTPTNPTSPESLGLQTPSVTASQQTPPVQERSQGLIAANQQSAYAAAPQGLTATATSPTYTQMIVPTGTYAPNNLYIFYAPQTVAGCYLSANLPLWMDISGSGNIWFYEWYPQPYGNLVTTYAGYVYQPGWYKRWFIADVPGWHILQYYCNGWSNYAYIYVYGSGSGGYYPTPSPGPQPYPYPYPYGQSQGMTTYPSTGHTYYSFKSSTTMG